MLTYRLFLSDVKSSTLGNTILIFFELFFGNPPKAFIGAYRNILVIRFLK